MAGSLTYPDRIVISNSAGSGSIAQNWVYVGDFRRFSIEIQKVSGSGTVDVYATNEEVTSATPGDTNHAEILAGISSSVIKSTAGDFPFPLAYIWFKVTGGTWSIVIFGERYFARMPNAPQPPATKDYVDGN